MSYKSLEVVDDKQPVERKGLDGVKGPRMLQPNEIEAKKLRKETEKMQNATAKQKQKAATKQKHEQEKIRQKQWEAFNTVTDKKYKVAESVYAPKKSKPKKGIPMPLPRDDTPVISIRQMQARAALNRLRMRNVRKMKDLLKKRNDMAKKNGVTVLYDVPKSFPSLSPQDQSLHIEEIHNEINEMASNNNMIIFAVAKLLFKGMEYTGNMFDEQQRFKGVSKLCLQPDVYNEMFKDAIDQLALTYGVFAIPPFARIVGGFVYMTVKKQQTAQIKVKPKNNPSLSDLPV